VLSRGLLSGSKPTGPQDFRAYLPRFSAENIEKNRRLVGALQAVATELSATASQVAIAWVLAKGRTIVPVIGARTRTQLAESLGALNLKLDAEAMAKIEAAMPAGAAAGERYGPQQMQSLDSERVKTQGGSQ
jgi:aryl-alcohol dehydrogenase-like predicted oxidoreductase